jgi:hypothetical protein
MRCQIAGALHDDMRSERRLQAENKSLREICSLCIFEFKVVRFIPSFPAAPAMTPFASRRAPRMSCFSELRAILSWFSLSSFRSESSVFTDVSSAVFFPPSQTNASRGMRERPTSSNGLALRRPRAPATRAMLRKCLDTRVFRLS